MCWSVELSCRYRWTQWRNVHLDFFRIVFALSICLFFLCLYSISLTNAHTYMCISDFVGFACLLSFVLIGNFILSAIFYWLRSTWISWERQKKLLAKMSIFFHVYVHPTTYSLITMYHLLCCPFILLLPLLSYNITKTTWFPKQLLFHRFAFNRE